MLKFKVQNYGVNSGKVIMLKFKVQNYGVNSGIVRHKVNLNKPSGLSHPYQLDELCVVQFRPCCQVWKLDPLDNTLGTT